MLFCSREFLIFFTIIFTAYWAMPSRRARLGLLLLAGGYFLYATGNVVIGIQRHAWTWQGVIDVLGGTGGNYWMAALLCLSFAIAFVRGHDRARVWLLMFASFYFYASWNKWLALIICISTALDYLIAQGMERSSSVWLRRVLLTVSIVANLGLLCYFKYANFFLQSVQEALHAVGNTSSLPVLSVILPVGISFYTFEAINYTVDVYRRKVRAERNLGHFMLFITFFPHLVAGPIVRARDFLPQIHRRKHWDWARMQLGAQYFLMGLFKKLAIADRMALFADPVFKDPSQYNTGAVWLAVLAYAIQIYCDFSGYTDMALGAAHMLGYKLAQNFNMPYLARNVSEFWHRWHMSLSTWLRDYLFIPLGGSRGTKWQTNCNLLITMTLGGLWHGASWTFVVWGILHGVMLIIHREFRDFVKPRPRLDRVLQSVPGMVLCGLTTFLAVCVGWVFFRAQTFGAAAEMLHRMVIPSHGMTSPLHNRSLWATVAVMALCHALAHKGVWNRLADRLPAPVLGFGYAFVLTLALVLAPDTGKQFIYFQF
jgi:alginate O-acetyltransferase complex protein AlgI